MNAFGALHLDDAPIERAPDGSAVDVLLRLERGALTRFTLPAGVTSRAVMHRTVDEIWLFLSGTGLLWRRQATREEVVAARPGLSVTIPVGTCFQLRADASDPLVVVATTMPPWPGNDEAIIVNGRWPPSVPEAEAP
jgi:mannose-6-phosphate isomerase-like protein (cupin superfamily)